MAGDDKRSAPRATYPCEVDCLGPSGTAMHLRIADVSATGAFLDGLTTLPAGTPLRLRFSLGSDEITVDAVVRHEMRGIGMGVHFTGVSGPQADLITRFVASHS